MKFLNLANKVILPRSQLLFKPIQQYSDKAVASNTSVATRPEGQVAQADILSGTPDQVKERVVRIYQPSKTAMQSGLENTRSWKLDFDNLEGAGRWENPLMGWASSADALQALKLKFKTKEQAIYFAEKQGWNYNVQEPKQPKFRKKLYAENFMHYPGKLRMLRTK